MEIPPLYQAIAVALVTCSICVLLTKKMKKKSKGNSKKLIEPPGWWPLIGHLKYLTGPMQIHRRLAVLADKYGPVFSLDIGFHQTVVVTSRELAKECFTTNDIALANRPSSFVGKLMCYDYGMFGFAPYGPYWREARRIAALELLSTTRLEFLRHVRVTEVSMCVNDLYAHYVQNGLKPVTATMNRIVEDLIFNVVMRMIAGKRYFGEGVLESDEEAARRFRGTVKDFLRFLGAATVYDALPFLGWFDLKGTVKAMKKTSRDMDSIMQGWIDEHRVKSNGGDHTDRSKDFIDVLLSMVGDGHLSTLSNDADTAMKAIALTLITAGVDSTSTTIIWILSLLMKNRPVLEKAQAELDANVGKDRVVDESDFANLAYMHAIIKETLRLYPPAPLMVPHEAKDDCDIGGYHIRRGTRLLVNLWKIQRDPRVWSDPDAFVPERFLTNHLDLDIRGKHFEIFPFGSGRRSCPGMGLALQVMPLMLARMLQAFDFMEIPDLPVDLEEGSGIFLSKVSPLKIMLSPRLAPELYK